jgi:hypothetical protein
LTLTILTEKGLESSIGGRTRRRESLIQRVLLKITEARERKRRDKERQEARVRKRPKTETVASH